MSAFPRMLSDHSEERGRRNEQDLEQEIAHRPDRCDRAESFCEVHSISSWEKSDRPTAAQPLCRYWHYRLKR